MAINRIARWANQGPMPKKIKIRLSSTIAFLLFRLTYNLFHNNISHLRIIFNIFAQYFIVQMGDILFTDGRYLDDYK